MTLTETVASLKQEQTTLQQTISSCQERLARVTAALTALEGPLPSAKPTAAAAGPSVYEMAEAALLAYDHGAVIDYKPLAQKIISLHPSADPKLVKRGIYHAVATLKKKGKLVLCPGGFKRNP